jgi:invasion protein IalB
VDLALTRSKLPGASLAPWLLAAVLVLNAPVTALAQASQAAPSQATPSQQPESTAPKPKTATPSPRDGQQFQDWKLRCKAAEGQPELCEMEQRVENQKGDRVLLAVVGRVRSLDAPGMLILLPLGIALPPGVSLKVDDGDQRPLEVKLCAKEGCHAEQAPLKPDLLGALKAGTKGMVTFYVYTRQGKQQQVNIPVSLLGFSAALAEVMK